MLKNSRGAHFCCSVYLFAIENRKTAYFLIDYHLTLFVVCTFDFFYVVNVVENLNVSKLNKIMNCNKRDGHYRSENDCKPFYQAIKSLQPGNINFNHCIFHLFYRMNKLKCFIHDQ